MADEYVTKCVLTVNGQDISDFSQFSENERVHRRVVELMNKTGFSKVTARYGFSLTYVESASGDLFDFENVQNATCIVEFDGGRRILFSGVSCLSEGESSVDGEKEKDGTKVFMATGRREE